MISLRPIPKLLATDLEYQYLEIDFLTEVKPEYLKTLQLPKIDFDKGLVIGGNAPIWFYNAFITQLLLTSFQDAWWDGNYDHLQWVATYDEKLGAVVFWETVYGLNIVAGDVIPFA